MSRLLVLDETATITCDAGQRLGVVGPKVGRRWPVRRFVRTGEHVANRSPCSVATCEWQRVAAGHTSNGRSMFEAGGWQWQRVDHTPDVRSNAFNPEQRKRNESPTLTTCARGVRSNAVNPEQPKRNE